MLFAEVWVTEGVISSLSFHPVERLLVIATYNELHFWDWSSSEPAVKVYLMALVPVPGTSSGQVPVGPFEDVRLARHGSSRESNSGPRKLLPGALSADPTSNRHKFLFQSHKSFNLIIETVYYQRSDKLPAGY
jgi:hypothetical protein